MNSRCFWEEVAENRYKKIPPSSLFLTPWDPCISPEREHEESQNPTVGWSLQSLAAKPLDGAGLPSALGYPVCVKRKKSQPRAPEPPGRALISHTFSPDSYWLGWKPHIKTHQSFHLSLMKASTETAALHMWFKLISYPDGLTLAGWPAFLIFTILFCFTLRICLSLLAKAEEHNEAGSTSFLKCLK